MKSVSTSDYKNFEFVVVDDDSTDDSLNIVNLFHCKIIRMTENAGPAAARNKRAEASRGEILFFLDSDIIIETNTMIFRGVTITRTCSVE